jgi:hypothetical protein
MGWFKTKAPRPIADWAGPNSFADWSEDDITAISAAIRKKNGQPGMPNWCMWVEYARPAVAAIVRSPQGSEATND